MIVAFLLILFLSVDAQACNTCRPDEDNPSVEHCTLRYCGEMPPINTDHRGPVVVVEHDPCLDQMKAAMRAMDEFVPFEPTPLTSTLVHDACLYDPVCTAKRQYEEVIRKIKARDLWNDAKHCWTQGEKP